MQIPISMKRENQPNPLQYGKEDLDFLDDRIQFLDTVRRMIDIELEQRGVNSAGDPHPDNTPLTLGTGREPPNRQPPCRGSWQRLMRLFRKESKEDQ